MSGSRFPRSYAKFVLGLALAVALICAIPAPHGVPTVSAQVPGITFCPTATVQAANVNCNTATTIFCPGGGLAGPLQACPINAPMPSILNSSPTVSVNLQQICPNGIALSVTQTCPGGGATVATTTAARALQQGGGSYCTLPSGGQVWVPAGSSPDAMGCSSATSGATTAPSAATTAATTIGVGQASGKSILTDANGMTLYTLSADRPGVSNCTGGCTAVWPPLTLASGTPTAPSSVTGTLAVITRSDGSRQVTYNGLPLYRYSRDRAPGDTNGQGIMDEWGTWSLAVP